MATINPFDLLDDDTEDPSLLAAQLKIEPKKAVVPPAKQPPQPKLPSKPLPPAQAVREAKAESARGGRGGGRGFGRGRGGHNREGASNGNSYGNREFSAPQGAPDKDGNSYERRGGYGAPRGSFRGGRRGGYTNGEAGEEVERPRRTFDRRSGTGRGNEMKREGSGRGNWGAPEDELAPSTEEAVDGDEKNLNVEKPPVEENTAVDGEKEAAKDENEEKEAEDKEMTLEEYEKVLEEKRKALVALKTEARKVDGKEFASMQQLTDKKANDEVFIKLGSENEKKKDLAEKEQKAKKSVSINEFLKPAEGERYHNPGGRGRGRGRGPRGGGYVGSNDRSGFQAPAIEDPGQFPTLGGKQGFAWFCCEMATINPFDLLGDDTEDPSLLAAQQKIEQKKTIAPPPKHAVQPKLPSKPVPPAQAVREAKYDSARGGGRGRGRGYARDGGARPNRDFANNENSYGNKEVFAAQGAPDEVDGRSSERRGGGYGGPRGSFSGGRRGGYSNGDSGEGDRDRTRRPLERRSGTGRGTEMKREGSGRGNWGMHTDELAQVTEEVGNEDEKNLNVEKPLGEEDAAENVEKEGTKEENEEKPEDKEMTLEEYEKLLEEKRKALLGLKSEERKVDAKEFESMQALSNKKANDDIFIKLGSEKDKKKELAEKEERAKKAVSINEFLKPAEGEKYYSPGGRGRGRGRGGRGGGFGGPSDRNTFQAPAIEDPGQFPTLGGK
ncbi:RNA-binding protein FUS-like [Salvia hispanica]|uniref:RNA-binding protein FUS-like n=1 Tax=Salvia hispanica TaxID=49212 RepID=UPI0020092936|nr:RNA-binding protein FUS-like [Salvia hispanica]